MACHTVHYDTTVLGRLVPFVSVSVVMLPGLRRSARDKAAREKAMKESEEGAARDSDAEDAYEDSDGPGPDPGRAQVHGTRTAARRGPRSPQQTSHGRVSSRLTIHDSHPHTTGHTYPSPPVRGGWCDGGACEQAQGAGGQG